MQKIRKWLLMGSAGFLAGGFLLLLVVTAAGAFAEDLSAAFGGRRTGAAAGNMDPAGNVPGKATYVGVDDTETDFSRRVAAGIAASKPDPPQPACPATAPAVPITTVCSRRKRRGLYQKAPSYFPASSPAPASSTRITTAPVPFAIPAGTMLAMLGSM